MCQMFHDLKELASMCFPGELSSAHRWQTILWIYLLWCLEEDVKEDGDGQGK
jgi:hypothetical protein